MRANGVSTSSIIYCMNFYNKKLESNLTQLRKETVTGQYSDFGVNFGSKVSDILGLSQENQHIKNMRDSNNLAKVRLSVSQESLKLIDKTYQNIRESIIISNEAGEKFDINFSEKSKEYLKYMTDLVNTTLNGSYLFAGNNTSEKPLQDYFAKDSPAKKSFDKILDDFLTNNSKDKKLNIADMNSNQMAEFIDKLEQFFLDNDYWDKNWSNASYQNIKQNINGSDVIDVSVNANIDGIRRLALCSVIGIELIGKDISPESREVISTKMFNHISKGLEDINKHHSLLGISEKSIDEVNLFLEKKETIIETYVTKTIGIDKYKTIMTLEDIINKIDISYAITAKINKLSFLKVL
ncbi:flagellar hook-associated family protein [Candidatus Liberibacter americanus]|uniref:Flagellin n=1 Tax=Candidatus Liberibacter americanus str. Sao Paulo TaxID=1261131 RepID=U6B3Y0_9HYPH|nr:flagellar hook-associated family protein [Candidatus Liberibacter americanus]AHA27759.1 Flagellar hook-associated protein FlgL [Candidatus Liberibacter americanus str. Sao Paulo]EMS36144.1 flagellar hook-associated protein FlgL [Candidatus Liberibacter americanus PW_SP]